MNQKALQCACVSLWLMTSLFAQDQPFTLRINTRLIVETVSVADKDGRLIEGLTKDDFTITEDGVPQNLSVFEFEKLDDTAPPRPPMSIEATTPDRIAPATRGT